MKMVLLDVSGTGMQHRLQGVGLRQELGYCSPPPLKISNSREDKLFYMLF